MHLPLPMAVHHGSPSWQSIMAVHHGSPSVSILTNISMIHIFFLDGRPSAQSLTRIDPTKPWNREDCAKPQWFDPSYQAVFNTNRAPCWAFQGTGDGLPMGDEELLVHLPEPLPIRQRGKRAGAEHRYRHGMSKDMNRDISGLISVASFDQSVWIVP